VILVAILFYKTIFGYKMRVVGNNPLFAKACGINMVGTIVAAQLIGGALADLISGYPHWAIPTAIIKAVNAVPFVLCRMAMKKRGKDEKIISPSSLLMLIPTTIVTIGGYFIANGLMYDFGAAIAELPTCWLQPGVGALIYIVVGIGLDKINFKKKLSL